MLAAKESTTVNTLMLMDCLAAVPLAVIGAFQQSPLYRGINSVYYCLPHLVLYTALTIFNRMVPVAIALFRYVAKLGFLVAQQLYRLICVFIFFLFFFFF